MNFETAFIECSHSNNYIFNNSKQGDVLFYPSKSNQDILIGTTLHDKPCITINNNNLGINNEFPQEKVDINGNTFIRGNIYFQNENGSITTDNLHHGIFFNTLADEKKLIINHLVDSQNSIELLNQIPIYSLQDNPKLSSIGCLSKDLKNIYPSCVNTVNNIEMIDYTKLIPILISSIKYLYNNHR